MKRIICLFVLVGLVGFRLMASAEPYQSSVCPDGSYNIGEIDGEVICKLEPTGCPYGDSIPMEDCSKFEPKVEAEIVPEPIEVQGK